MKQIFYNLKQYKKEAILGPLFKLFEAVLELFIPLVIKRIADVGINNRDIKQVILMGIALVVIAIVGLAFSVTAQYFSAKAAVGVSASLKRQLFVKIQSLSYTDIDVLGTSSMITRMTSDINQVQTGINLVLRLFLRSPLIVFGAMIMSFTVNFKAALVFVVVIPLLAIVVFGVMLVTIPLYKKVQNLLDKVLSKTRENLTGSRVIRAFSLEKEEINDFENKNFILTKYQKFVGRISGLLNPLTYVIINLGILAIIYVGSKQIPSSSDMTQGSILALYNYMGLILVELIKFANLIITINKSIACSHRIEEVINMEPSKEKNDNFLSTSKYIYFDNVSLKYKNASLEALSNINFSVNKGEVVGIIGSTGSGKSSLVNLIPHFYDCTKGSVYIEGKDVKSYDEKTLRSKIGVVFQHSTLFNATIRDNIKYGAMDATDEEIYEALKIAQGLEIVNNKEEGLDHVVSQGGKNLSGGQKQRLAIARALVRKPEILILDDSSSALDYATDKALRQALKSLDNVTVFIVTQRASTILHANKIIVLDDGKIVGIGTHQDLITRCGIYQEIYYSQYPKEARDEK